MSAQNILKIVSIGAMVVPRHGVSQIRLIVEVRRLEVAEIIIVRPLLIGEGALRVFRQGTLLVVWKRMVRVRWLREVFQTTGLQFPSLVPIVLVDVIVILFAKLVPQPHYMLVY